MKVLLFGASGQLGLKLRYQLQQQGIDSLALDRAALDLGDVRDITRLILQENPDVVVNAAAYTAVDKAQIEPELAYRINRDAPLAMAKACSQVSCVLIHFSTDYVFDGLQQRDYLETDAPNPLNIYGESKLAGEQAIQDNLKQHLIIRTSWVFSDSGNNFVRTILRLAKSQASVSVVADQQGCPTYAGDLAHMTLSLLARLEQQRQGFPWGLYHFSGRPATHWADFARAIHQHVAADEKCLLREIVNIRSEQYPTAAQRPQRCILNCDRFQTSFGLPLPEWRASLAEVVAKLWAEV